MPNSAVDPLAGPKPLSNDVSPDSIGGSLTCEGATDPTEAALVLGTAESITLSGAERLGAGLGDDRGGLFDGAGVEQ